MRRGPLHSPPRNALDLGLRFGVREIGSKALRAFIEKNEKRAPLVVCGHVHSQGGLSMQIEKTTIVNVASHDNPGEPGRIAIIDLINNKVQILWYKILGEYETNEVLRIFRVGPKTFQKLKEAGITTLDKLIAADIEGLSKSLACAPHVASKILTRAKAVSQKKIIPFGKISPLEDDAALLDIETDLTQNLVWLIGIYFPRTDELIQLVAHNPSEEKTVLEDFLKKIHGFTGKIYTFSGTKFDERVIKKRLLNFGLDTSKLPEFIDLGICIQRSFALPFKSYGLKSIAEYLGYKYKHPELDGRTVASQ